MEYSWSWYWIPPVVVLFIIIWRVIRARRLQQEQLRSQQESIQANQTDQNNQVFVVQPGNPQQPTASQWSPSAPPPDYGIHSNDSEQIQIKPRRWF